MSHVIRAELRGVAAAFVSLAIIGGCQREAGVDDQRDAGVDEATIDEGRFRNPTTTPTPTQSPTTLQSGATILATPAGQALQDYLNSAEPAGRRFPLPSIHFIGQSVREDPNGAVASLAAVLNQHPNARIRVEVGRPARGVDQPIADTHGLARQVAQVFVDNGVDAGRIESTGVIAESDVEPTTFLVVTAK